MTELEMLKNINKEHKQLLESYFKLQEACKTLYLSACWKSDRLPKHIEDMMWKDLKEAAEIHFNGPEKIR